MGGCVLIALFTDFGTGGPYLGQVRSVLGELAPGVPVVDLMNDAPVFDPRAAAYLLSSLLDPLPADVVIVGVVDPGVGAVERAPVVVEVDGRFLVGPGNGLFSIAVRHATRSRSWRIDWRPERLAPTFHGRDLFAPVAARIAIGGSVPGQRVDALPGSPEWPPDLPEVIYVDGFGNAWTGLRGAALGAPAVLRCGGRTLQRARTFGDVPPGVVFWYENSCGLVEIAGNQANAAQMLGLSVGTVFEVCAQ